ncbi:MULTISPECIES: MerR family transcriptional regulator [unclassified Streptomyces]|uniref:MerR family transcriptional regulator n=1 Tax=unclassified Streptomyces TaxID=2593676 RepID=UPI0008238018|nr:MULTISPECIES: MerR family transcriptional regulator [unclassified Streptomyces]AWN31700.1 MerR family transcriptional regulator [Streptomyces sp. NEAU-S7GS2]MYT11170.1 MerR family transcriptional regulator [Streptomyces sp. SID4951]SCK07311.1 DNA-binding transcriptional regulator, MerR family [Streptomyces sp. SceaMP-e96]
MRIGELARRSGVSERSLRYYETQGLLRAERTPGGQRHYGEWAVDRVIRIQALYAAGLNSKKIAQLLPCMRDADGGPSEIATPRLVTELTAERERIDRMITDLIRSRDVLDEAINTASADPPASVMSRADTTRLHRGPA